MESQNKFAVFFIESRMVLMGYHYELQLPHIFDIPSIVNEKLSASNKKKISASIKILRFRAFSKHKNNFWWLVLNLSLLFM